MPKRLRQHLLVPSLGRVLVQANEYTDLFANTGASQGLVVNNQSSMLLVDYQRYHCPYHFLPLLLIYLLLELSHWILIKAISRNQRASVWKFIQGFQNHLAVWLDEIWAASISFYDHCFSEFFQQFGSAGGTSVKKIIKKSFFSMIILVMSTCTHYQKNKASLLVTSRQLGGITKSVWNHSKLPD